MEKKLTKKELKEIEERDNQLRYERRRFIDDVKSFWNDLEAAERYLKIKGEKLTNEEELEILHRYENLKGLKLAQQYNKEDADDYIWSFIRNMVFSEQGNYRGEPVDKYLTIKLGKDDLLVSEDYTIWSFSQMKMTVREAKRFGYKNLFIMSNSTLAMQYIGQLVELGGKVTGTTYNTEYDRFGVIINIEEASIEEKEVEDYIVEDIRKELEYLGDNVKYDMYTRDIKARMLLKYSRSIGLVAVYNVFEKIKIELRDKAVQPKEEK